MKPILWKSAAGAAVIATLAWAFWPRPMEVDVASVRTGTFERHVQEQGKTRVRARYAITAPLAGTLARITLQQGDSVAQGAVIATLTPVAPALIDSRSQQEQAERVGAMEANVARAGAAIERAQVALVQARADLQRSQTLAKQGFVSPTQSESGALTVQLREKDLEAARLEEHGARHELEQLRIALRRVREGGALAAQWVVRSPVAGRVLRVHKDSEGVVAAGTPLVDIGEPTQLEVQVDLLSEDAAQVRAGAAALLTHWGGSKDLNAQVRRVEPAAFTKVSALGVEEQRVNVLLDITSPAGDWPALGDGFKTDVRILVQAAEQATLVPVSAVFPAGKGSAVYVLDQGRAREQAVTLRARNGRDAWIEGALPNGTQVVVYPPPALKDGTRIRARNTPTAPGSAPGNTP